jgi:predicted nuclease of predicted toxin-antitoxin system
MRVLLDEHLPIALSRELHGHAVDTVAGRGWAGIKNGELLSRMKGHYDVLITMDRGIEFQQRFSTLPFGIVIVRAASNRMQHLRPLVPAVLAAITAAKPGQVERVGA